MKRAHRPQSSSSEFTPSGDSDFVYSSAERAVDSAQIMSRMMNGEDIDSLMLSSIDTLGQRVSENKCQSQICLPHLQNSHSQIAAFTVAPSQTADAQAAAQKQAYKEETNQPPIIYESPERETNIAPDEGNQRTAKTATPDAPSNVRSPLMRELRSQPQATPMPWQGTVRTTNRAVKAKRQPTPHAFQDTIFQDASFQDAPFQDAAFQDSSFQDSSFQDTAFRRTAFQKAKRTIEHASRAYLPEPALQPTTYQIPIRSKEVTFVNAIICSFPRLIMLFLLGIGIAYMAGLAFPSVFSWLVLSSVLSGLIRGLGLVVLVSLAIAFVLEFR